MLRRTILGMSTLKSDRRIPWQITTQVPAFLSSRKEFSSKHTQKDSQGAASGGNKSESGSYLPKVVLGSIALGTVAVAAYQSGYLDVLIGKEQQISYEPAHAEAVGRNESDVQHPEQLADLSHSIESNVGQKVEQHGQMAEAKSDLTFSKDLSEIHGKNQLQAQGDSNSVTIVDTIHVQEEDSQKSSSTTMVADDQSPNSKIPSEGTVDLRDTQVLADKCPDLRSALIDDYELKHDADTTIAGSSTGKDTNGRTKIFEKEGLVSTVEDLDDAHVPEDGKLVLDFLQAIHAAEKKQAELDAHLFAEERRTMKEKYENKLKDARARELMYAEEAAILDKELNRERMKASAAIKALQEKAEEKLRMELEEKEKEAEIKFQKLQELAKAELTAAIASEKASHIEKMAEANLHIKALCMAFFARSEEARQHHSVHKLALGALVLEDTLSRGLPIQNEIKALQSYLGGTDKGSLLDLVLLSLPEETQNSGTDTLLQLNLKFDALKGTLRHFSLIPPNGGGILTHSVAYLASSLKVKGTDRSGDGIESVINRVESYLAEGKLAEAADVLEEGVKGSQAAEVSSDWVRRVRNRAITEQALTLLQSYATSISLT